MSGKTPNLDKLAAQGMMFTDYYAKASCTAGRANFITGELPIRTGMKTLDKQASANSRCRSRESQIGLNHAKIVAVARAQHQSVITKLAVNRSVLHIENSHRRALVYRCVGGSDIESFFVGALLRLGSCTRWRCSR